MIGDGMGKNHIETAKKYYELDSLYMENLENMKVLFLLFLVIIGQQIARRQQRLILQE